MNWDDVHLPDEAHGSHMTTPHDPRRAEGETNVPSSTDGRTRPDADPIVDNVELDLDLDSTAVETFFAEWKAATAQPPRIDTSLAALLEHGIQRRMTAVPEVPTPVVESTNDNESTSDDVIPVATVIDLDEARRRRGRTRRVVVRGAVVGLASLTVSSGLAAAGVLPSPVQRAVSNAADVVGIHIEQPERPQLGEVVVDTTTPPDTRVIPRRPQRGGTPASVVPVPPTTSGVGAADPGEQPGSEDGSGNPDPTTAPKTSRPDRDAPTTTAPSDAKRQCPAGEVPTNSGDEPDGCRPCRTRDPETGELIPNWKLAHKCQPCPSERSGSDAERDGDDADDDREPRKRARARARDRDEGRDDDGRRHDRNRRRGRDRHRDRQSGSDGYASDDDADQRQRAIGTRTSARPLHHCAPQDRSRSEAEEQHTSETPSDPNAS